MTLDLTMRAARVAGEMGALIVALELLVDELADDKLNVDVELARTGILSAIERLNRLALAGGPELEQVSE
jgi:hypothetical protein